MRTPYLLALSRLVAVAFIVVLINCGAFGETGPVYESVPASPGTGGVTSQGDVSQPASPDVFAQQSILLFFAVFILAVCGLRGKKVISTLATVRLLGASMAVGSSIFLAFSQLNPGRLMPVMVLLGVSLGLLFPGTEGADPEQREHLAKLPTTRDTSKAERPSNDQGQAGIAAARSQEAEENSDASGSSSL
jgi:hypothetical protein